MSRIKAVLFDLDGVLIDSLDIHFQAWTEVLRSYGVHNLTRFDVALREGEKAEVSAREFAKKFGLELTKEDITALLAKKRSIYAENAPKALTPGAGNLLRKLKREGFQIGLVTGSVAKNLKEIMTAEEWDIFDMMITGGEVTEAKPSPEPYIKAAEKLGLRTEDCLAIENAPLGIESAKKAGMKVIAITSTLPADYLREADWIVDSIEGVGRVI